MQGVSKIYLGWGNPRSAFSIDGHSVVVLIDGASKTVLQDGAANGFRADASGLSNHLCGVRHSSKAENLVKSVSAHPSHLPAYDAIFDRYFSKSN